MRASRFTDEQVVGFLKPAEAGIPVRELCRQGGGSDATSTSFHADRLNGQGLEMLAQAM